MTCYEATFHAIWLWNFISTLEVVHSISRPLKLLYDNSTVVSFFRNTRRTSRSKHIDVKFFFVKDKVVESPISVEYTPTTSMLANPLPNRGEGYREGIRRGGVPGSSPGEDSLLHVQCFKKARYREMRGPNLSLSGDNLLHAQHFKKTGYMEGRGPGFES